MNSKAQSHLVVDGISTIKVEGGDLVIRDGVPCGSRTRTLSRIESDITRIIVPSRHGSISWDAMAWLMRKNITITALCDGELVMHAENSHLDANLRRSQARAADNETGVDIARYLLHHKLRGQRDVVLQLDELTAKYIDTCLGSVGKLDIEECRGIEAQAAKKYFHAWRNVAVTWSTEVPEHWRTFGQRYSPIAKSSARTAANPLNAMLNYAYGVLEGETSAACLKLGLDPLLGITHRDKGKRRSMCHDLMEPGRPIVDGLLLDWMGHRSFKKTEFIESATGVVRLKPAIHEEISALVVDSTTEYHQHWEHVAHKLSAAADGSTSAKRTPLTRSNRIAAAAKLRGIGV